MAITNFLDSVTYPNFDKRPDILNNYFDTRNLQLDIKPFLTLNNLTEKITVDLFNSLSLFDTINKDLRENIRRYNNDVFYVTDSIYRMVNYYELMNKSSTDDQRITYELLFRKSARCVCTELFMYEEKIKNLLRIMLKFDKRKTQKYDVFTKELKKQANHNKHVKAFKKTYSKYRTDSNVKFIRKIRNDEIHNDSAIDEYTDIQPIATGVISHCDVFYVVSNDMLYNNIKGALQQLEKLKNNLQLILNNHKV